VYNAARIAGSSRVYWQTQVKNLARRALSEKLAEHKGFFVYSSTGRSWCQIVDHRIFNGQELRLVGLLRLVNRL
jgi:hypothetical protein